MSVTLSSINKFEKASPFNATYTTIYNAFGTKPTETYAGYQNTLVEGLKTDGIWAKLDIFYVFANSNAADALINWITPGSFTCTESGAGDLTFTAYEGYTGDGTNYLNTGYTPSVNYINWTNISGACGFYLRLNRTDDGYNMGGGGPYYLALTGKHSDGNLYGRINATSPVYGAVTPGNGFFVGSRRANDDIELYNNGSSIATASIFGAGGVFEEISILTMVWAGETTPTQNQVSIAFVSSGLTDTEVSDFNTRVETYMDALGKGVQ